MIASIFTQCLANTSCFAPQKRIEIEFGKQAYRQKERDGFFDGKFCSVWRCHWAVSQQLNIFAYLSGYWHIKRHSSTPPSLISPHFQHTHSLWTWQLHFISSSTLSLHFCPDVLFARHLIRSSRLITLCIPYPLNVRSTEASLLGEKDRLRDVTLLGLTIRCIIPLRTKPLISEGKLVCMYQQDKVAKSWLALHSTLHKASWHFLIILFTFASELLSPWHLSHLKVELFSLENSDIQLILVYLCSCLCSQEVR